MKKHIEQIINEVINFSFTGYTVSVELLDSLRDVLKTWIGYDGYHLVSHTISEHGDIHIVVGEMPSLDNLANKEPDTKLEVKMFAPSYSLYRFFRYSGKYQVSKDFADMDAEEMMHELTQLINNK